MKKFILIIILMLLILFSVLSTTGIETSKFNSLVEEKVSSEKNINVVLNTIRFKINLKELDLFLETQNPEITYKESSIPINNLKVFIDFLSFLKSDPKIKKIRLSTTELDITQLNQFSFIKPSNFKSLLHNKIKEGKLISEIEIFFSNKGKLDDFIAKGEVKDLKLEIFNNLIFNNVNLNFIADKNDILIKNINGDLEDIKISKGDIKLNLEKGLNLSSNFNSELSFDKKLLNKYSKFINQKKFIENINNIKTTLNNNISINLDKTYKLKDYDYKISGTIHKSEIELSKIIKNDYILKEIEKIYLSDLQISTNFKDKKIIFKGKGKYSFNNLDFLNINLENNYKDDVNNLIVNFDYSNNLYLDFINFKKKNDSIAKISLNLEKKNLKTKINKFSYIEGRNLIKIFDLIFEKNKFITLKKAEIKTYNNDFTIQYGKKISIKGNKFDGTNLTKFFSGNKGTNKLKNINKNIEIDFKDIKAPMSENLKNFKLLGQIKKGQFITISSKGDFGGDNFLDITMKKDKNSDRRYLEIYSDLTRPLLTDYSFFKGLSGGKLFFNSIIDEKKSFSNLKIENFKVINAPGLIKLLSLADLSGLEDLAKGEGLSFDVLEIDMEKNNEFLKLNEILALGSSMSVLMDGYQDKNGLTSLRGTLVPAKTLNKMISKIPVIGKIVIPKEVGEGLFGLSFKMKGPKGNIKTTINPIKTVTPRFIQKIIERNKDSK